MWIVLYVDQLRLTGGHRFEGSASRLAVRLGRSGARAHRVTDTMPRPTTTGTRDLLLTCEAPLANPRSEQPRTRLARDPLPYLPEPLPAAAGTGGAPSPATPHRPRASGGIPSSLGTRCRSPPPPLAAPGAPASHRRRRPAGSPRRALDSQIRRRPR